MLPIEDYDMTIPIEAVFENGTSRPAEPVSLPEGATVRLTIAPVDETSDPLAAVIGSCDGPPDGAGCHDRYVYGKPLP